MKRILILLVLLIGIFALSACGDKGYTNISNEELQTMLEEHPEYQFVDVRTLAEYNEAHVPGFTVQLDFYKLEDDYSLLDRLDKEVPVVLMCRTGNRSAQAAKIMANEGFTTIYNLTGGIVGWDGETE